MVLLPHVPFWRASFFRKCVFFFPIQFCMVRRMLTQKNRRPSKSSKGARKKYLWDWGVARFSFSSAPSPFQPKKNDPKKLLDFIYMENSYNNKKYLFFKFPRTNLRGFSDEFERGLDKHERGGTKGEKMGVMFFVFFLFSII